MEMIIITVLIVLSSAYLILTFTKKRARKAPGPAEKPVTATEPCQGCGGNCSCKDK